MTLENIFAYTILITIILTFLSLIPFLAFFRFTMRWEVYRKLYPVILLILIFMLILNITHVGFLAREKFIAEFLELVSILFIFITAIYITKNLSAEYILLKVARELEEKLKERTGELQDKSDKLLSQSRRLEGLYKAVKRLNAMMSLDLLIDNLLEIGRELTHARYAAFAICDGQGVERFITSGIGIKEMERIGDLPKGHGLLGVLRGSKLPLRVEKIKSHPRSCGFPPHHPRMETFLGVPIVSSAGESLGIVYLTEKEGGPFTKDDEDLMTALAIEIAVSMERIKLLNQISRARDEWQKTLDSIGDFVAIHNIDHRIVRVNLPLRKRLGLPFNSIVGKNCVIMEGIFFEKGKRCPHDRVVESKTHTVDEIVNSRGEVFFVSSYPSYDEKGKITATIQVAQDVSVFKKLARMEEERKKLEELSRFKSQFVSLVAHELRTPLTSLQGFSELLVNRELDRESQKRWSNIILEESQILGRLVNDILDLSKIETGHLEIKRESFSIDEILRKETERFRLRSTKHTYNDKIPATLPQVYGDKNRIFQVLTNLVDNATKYSPEGEEIVISAVAEDSEVKIGVIDKGYGIPEDFLEKIFEPFYRADMPETIKSGGTGLGLSISKTIIEAHGGKIWAESNEGKGSAFYFTIPLAGRKTTGKKRQRRFHEKDSDS